MKLPILFVDDDAATRELGVEILRDVGYTVFEAGQVSEAIQMLEDHPTTGLLFTDIHMPGRNGYFLADMAVTRWPHLRVLYTTGSPTTADNQRGSCHGEVLAKPYNAAQLSAAVAESLARSRPPNKWDEPHGRRP